VSRFKGVGNPEIAQLVTESYDYVELAYTGDLVTGIEYKIGGSGGTTVAVLTLTYDGSDRLETITKA